MKNLLLLCVLFSFYACTPKSVVLSTDTKAILNKSIADFAKLGNPGASSFEEEGNNLKLGILKDIVPEIRRKTYKTRRILAQTGIVTTSLGGISAGVNGLLDNSDDQKRTIFGFSVGTTIVGLIQVFSGGNEGDQYKDFLSALELAIAKWDVDPKKDQAAYSTFRLEIAGILGKFAGLYSE